MCLDGGWGLWLWNGGMVMCWSVCAWMVVWRAWLVWDEKMRQRIRWIVREWESAIDRRIG